MAIAVAFALTALALIDALFRQSDPSTMFILFFCSILTVGLSSMAIYWSVIAFKLNYRINRNGLTIQWGLAQQRIPFHHIETITYGESVAKPPRFRGINLAGLRIGWAEINEYGLLKFCTTAPITGSLLVVTPYRTYVISPERPQALLQAWEARKQLGTTQNWREEIQRKWPFNADFFTDRLTWWLIGAAALLCLWLLGYLALNYSDLPPSLPIHFDSFGQADRIADKVTIFILPTAGAIVWLVNVLLGGLVYQKEKVAAYFLWGSTIWMQLCLWVAALTITI